ncbi:telomerase reverse transcriptase-like isoform X1 [Schistocerca gregaria]|uniref:telomerase reverse transcriptase-like isoform X1 n=1 Tax=Schistocerca gregaria TaxID=7010 RepID=UPI00211DB1F5|nr:telomerase reverse transcriptase-like isoform X1 [Schistocerca gregaria]
MSCGERVTDGNDHLFTSSNGKRRRSKKRKIYKPFIEQDVQNRTSGGRYSVKFNPKVEFLKPRDLRFQWNSDQYNLSIQNSDTLLSIILHKNVGKIDGNPTKNINNDFTHLKTVLQSLIRKHRSTHYKEILKRCTGNSEMPLTDKELFGFLNVTISKTFPKALLGTLYNKKQILKFVHRLTLSSADAVHDLVPLICHLNMKSISWLKAISSYEMKKCLLLKVVTWIMQDFIFILFRSYFYSLGYNKKLVFYTKPVWKKLSQKAVKHLIDSEQFEPISPNQAQIIKTSGKNAPSTARADFRPKFSSLRPIFPLRFDDGQLETLKESRLLLQQLSDQFHELSLFRGADFNHSWSLLYHYWNLQGRKKMYFVKADISDAFGSILHSKMFSVLRKLRDIYIPEDGVLRKVTGRVLGQKPQDWFANIPYRRQCRWSAYWISTVEESDAEWLLHSAVEYMRSVTVQTSRKHIFHVVKGIPQGGSLSSVLCDLYYADFDHTHMREFLSHGYLFRYVDDYLYVTEDKEWAEQFLEETKHNYQDYNFSFNQAKTQTNINNCVKEIHYLGNVINCDTLEVTQEQNEDKLRDIRNTVISGKKYSCGRYLETVMKTQFLSMKPIMLNLKVNSRKTVLINVFGVALLAAYKFSEVIRKTFTFINVQFIFSTIVKSIRIETRRCVKISKRNCGMSLNIQIISLVMYVAFYMLLPSKEDLQTVLGKIKRLITRLSRQISEDVREDLAIVLSENIPRPFQTSLEIKRRVKINLKTLKMPVSVTAQ